MTNFDERLTYGQEAEVKFSNLLKKYGVEHRSTRSFPEYTTYFDLKNGDFFIYNNNKIIKVDVKRSGVSIKSINYFDGDVFAITDHHMNGFYIFPAASMRKYKKTCEENKSKIVVLSSGDTGIRFTKEQLASLRKAKTLEQWIKDDFTFGGDDVI